MEGASDFQIFSKIVIPIIKPTVAALAALTFVECWNIVDQAVVFIKNVYDEPLSVYLSKMIDSSPGLIFVAAVLYTIPAVLVFIISSDHIKNGITLSGGN